MTPPPSAAAHAPLPPAPSSRGGTLLRRAWRLPVLIAGTLALAMPQHAHAAKPRAKTAKHGAEHTVYVRAFHFEGNTVYKEEELGKIVAPYTGRRLTRAEIEKARIAVTQYYVDHGYINSGAVLREPAPAGDGTVTFGIVEGKLTDIRVSGNRWFCPVYLRMKARAAAGDPLNKNMLDEGLNEFRNANSGPLSPLQDIQGNLQPGAQPGEATLDLQVKDREPFHLALQADNQRPASVGGEEILIQAADVNLTGFNDPLIVNYGLARRTNNGLGLSGKDNIDVSYARPITPWDTTFTFTYSRQDYAVIEQDFNALNIQSEQRAYTYQVRQPVYRTAKQEAAVSVIASKEDSFTSLLGQPFTLSPGAVNGDADVFVLRFQGDYTQQGPKDILALRSTFSVGLDALGATVADPNRNGKFFAWRGEAQYVRRLSLLGLDSIGILRANGQVADRGLLALEQFSVGGANSVRGYRENELVRDDAYFASAELRVPILSRAPGDPILQLAPFFDVGGGWNVNAPTPNPRNIYSTGIGLIGTWRPYLEAQLYYGYGFVHISQNDRDIQDDGIHFLVRFQAF